ncbi:hypothetical protein PHLGIDRAFT_374817 [Phlebiopsis gigantea 11061_1 CR5-6]|uniref:Uncharacterized protein n=1 Tax=Phlebiopsis gigantea (strain 11061_1 CR5-6) TaxID=745531 RepID=A0A0C3PNT2_PHLG1|nr:hypothetical protein PHLGIDRAFT_374817 [Phlebiopsis gigantea 11061_1 CR5-6]
MYLPSPVSYVPVLAGDVNIVFAYRFLLATCSTENTRKFEMSTSVIHRVCRLDCPQDIARLLSIAQGLLQWCPAFVHLAHMVLMRYN